MAIVQIAKGTGNTVTFANPISDGNAVAVFAGFAADLTTNTRSPGDVVDDHGNYFLYGPVHGGGPIDYSFYQFGTVDLECQTWLRGYDTGEGGATTLTLSWWDSGEVFTGPSYDIFAVEFTVPSAIFDAAEVFASTFQDSSTAYSNNVIGQMDMFTDYIQCDYTSFDDANYVFVFCRLDAGSVVSGSAGWTLETINNSGLLYRRATSASDPSTHVSDGVFNLDATRHVVLVGESYYTTADAATVIKLTSTGGVDHIGAAHTLASDYDFTAPEILETDPSTGAPWTLDGVNATLYGAKFE